MTPTRVVPVLEIGGTHVTAACVDLAAQRVAPATRRGWDSGASREHLLETIVDAVSVLPVQQATDWGVAIPGPFDYDRGVGLFEGVGKFDALRSVDVGAMLCEALPEAMRTAHFLNDAHAFALGEWISGAATGHRRVVGLTLGTGVGSAFLVDGVLVDRGPTVPPNGHVYLLQIAGRSLEDTVSRRAIRRRYARLCGADEHAVVDLEGIAARARAGDCDASRALAEPMEALGATLAPWVSAFGASVLVVGGSVARSWDVVGGPLRSGLDAAADASAHRVDVTSVHRPEEAALLGAAYHAARTVPHG